MSQYTHTQRAAMTQAYYELPPAFQGGIDADVKAGRSPKDIQQDFLAIASIAPEHRKAFAKRLELAAMAVKLGLMLE